MAKEKVYFDRIGAHFLKNIYTRPKGKIRLAVLQRDLAPYLQGGRRLRLVDVGGGAGQMAMWALSLGHEVVLIDHSQAMLNQAQALAEERGLSDRLTLIEGEAVACLSAQPAQSVDMVFCHALLEWVEEGGALLHGCWEVLRPDGLLSLMYYNRQALVFAQHVFGNFDYLSDALISKNAAKLTPDFPRERQQVQTDLSALSMQLVKTSGVRCFYDYMKKRDKDRNSLEEIIERELALSLERDYWAVARYLHEIWRR